MKSCQDVLLELREKIRIAEDNLRSEKKNLLKIQDFFSDEKTKWAVEIKEAERKVRENEAERRQKEAEFTKLKEEYDAICKKTAKLGEENDKITRELRKVKTKHEDRMNVFSLEQGRLENELTKLQEQQRDLETCNKWTKVFQMKELSTFEADQEYLFKEECKLLSEDFARKMDAYRESLKEIDFASLQPKRAKLSELRECLKKITDECKEYESMNKDLEKQIEQLNKS